MTMVAKNNETFIGGHPTWANACVGQNGFPGYWDYAKGFSQAATILIDLVLQEKGLERSVDLMVYPVCFNMRHSVELRLKDAIEKLTRIGEYRCEILKFNLSASHDIGNIWAFFAGKAQSLDDRYQPLVDRLDKRITDIAEVDATGQTFRYPLDMESQKHLVDVSIISFVILKERFAELEAALDNLHELNRYLLHEYLWGSFTKRLSRKNLFELAALLPKHSTWTNESFCDTKNLLMKRFNIGSNELSKAIGRIKSHYELAPVIGLCVPLLGVEDVDVEDFLCHWLKQHNVLSGQESIDPEIFELGSDRWSDVIERNSRIQAEVWSEVQSNLTAEILAGLYALVNFAFELEFSECYISIYETGLEEAQLAFADSEGSVRIKYFHLYEKMNAVDNLLRSLYFLDKAELADRLIATYAFADKLSWLDDARNRILFQKPDYCGYGRLMFVAADVVLASDAAEAPSSDI